MKQFVTEEEGDRDDKGRDSDARRAPCGESTPFLFARILIVLREIKVNLSPWNTKVFSVPAFSPSFTFIISWSQTTGGNGKVFGIRGLGFRDWGSCHRKVKLRHKNQVNQQPCNHLYWAYFKDSSGAAFEGANTKYQRLPPSLGRPSQLAHSASYLSDFLFLFLIGPI